MSAAAAVRTRLLAVSGVSALTTRIFQGFVPKGATKPYVFISVIGGSPHGYIAGAAAIGETSLQLDVYGATGASRDALAEAIRNAIDGYAGAVGSTDLRRVDLDPPVHTSEGTDSGREQPSIYRARIDARVWFGQAVPTL